MYQLLFIFFAFNSLFDENIIFHQKKEKNVKQESSEPPKKKKKGEEEEETVWKWYVWTLICQNFYF